MSDRGETDETPQRCFVEKYKNQLVVVSDRNQEKNKMLCMHVCIKMDNMKSFFENYPLQRKY